MSDLLQNVKTLLHKAFLSLAALFESDEPAGPEEQITYFPSWTEGSPAVAAIKEYVEAVTDPASPDYIRPEERIVVSDFDGTLFGELNPIYFDWAMSVHRVLYDTSYEATEEQRAAALEIEETERTGNSQSDGMAKQANMAGQAYCGMTLNELWMYTIAFGDEPAPGFIGMDRDEAYFVPMLELIEYLQDNGFTFYVVTGTDRTIARAVIDDMIDIPPSQVIGSDNTLVATGQGDEDGTSYTWDTSDMLVYDGQFVVKDLNMNKVTSIAREICIKPVIAMGNASSDSSMISYVVNSNPNRALGLFVLGDDTERERGNPEKAAQYRQLCEEEGWVPISTKDDWKTIYGPDVTIDADWTWDHPDAAGPFAE